MVNRKQINSVYIAIVILLLGLTYIYSSMSAENADRESIINNENKLIMKAYLKFSDQLITVIIDTNNAVAKEFIKHLPINSIGHNIGGEVYFRTNGVDLKYDGTEQEVFEVGDVTYWRSPIGEDKFAIAIFYGNTQFSNWKSPRASSACVKIGKIVDNIEALKLVGSDEDIRFSKSK